MYDFWMGPGYLIIILLGTAVAGALGWLHMRAVYAFKRKTRLRRAKRAGR